MTAAVAFALAMPVQAEDAPTDNPKGEGLNLMEEGARLLLRGLLQDMEPALREMEGLSEQVEPALRGFIENFGPSLGAFLDQVEDFSKYHPPEILPNGDIILRRKTPQELLDVPKEGEVEL